MSRIRQGFRPRELFFHDGATMRRVYISTRIQAVAASVVTATLGLSLFATAQIAGAAPTAIAAISNEIQVARMQHQVATMQSDMMALKAEAMAHAARLEQRQAMLTAVLTGNGNPALPEDGKVSARAAAIVAPFDAVEGEQTAMAAQAMQVVEARYRATAAALGKFGVTAQRFHKSSGLAMGGPYEPVTAAVSGGKAQPDLTFRALFQSWKRLDQLQQGVVAIPSDHPVAVMTFTSGFGVRSDPFRGGAAMHAGVDMPGPVGTAIYATADGIVGRAGWSGGYGNLVELDHGRGIQTRYGHLSAILVQPGQHVKRGEQIARMGSTGRSTGSHLHYEVRLDGHAVNPIPFLQSANYLAAMQTRGSAVTRKVALGGPEE